MTTKLKLDSADSNNEVNRIAPYPDTWAEIPPNGRVCTHTGLKHAKLYAMLGKGGIARPFVRTANLRDPGAKQGKTLFHLGDMLRYLDKLAFDQGSGLNPTALQKQTVEMV